MIRQRRANEELTSAIDDGRVVSSLRERAETEAATRADRSRADEMRAAASKAANAMREAGGRVVDTLDAAVKLFESPHGDDPAAESRRKVGESRLLASQFRDAVLAELDRMKPAAPAVAVGGGPRKSPKEPPR